MVANSLERFVAAFHTGAVTDTGAMTGRLRLEPIGERHAGELLTLLKDPAVAEWYGEWTRESAEREAARIARAWRTDGVHKWMAYHRDTGEVVGRGGLSRQVVDGRDRLEVGWVLHRRFWGQGYATEIGRAALELASASSAPTRWCPSPRCTTAVPAR
jgi:ribosomal-protein-alanine N-acetyltransferase